jgi:hypothetical protein
MKHRNRGYSSEDSRGNTAGVTPGRFSTLSDINTIITAMKRESPPLDYGFVVVACPISLLCFNV